MTQYLTPPGYDPYRSVNEASGGRAAIATWVAAGAVLLLFGCCSGLFTFLAVTSLDDLRRMSGPEGMSAEQMEAMKQVKPVAIPFVAATLLVMVLPALIALVLGFFVNGGKRWAILAVLGIFAVQAVLVLLMLLAAVLGSVLSGDVVSAVMVLVLWGGLFALLCWPVVQLWSLRRDEGGSVRAPTMPVGYAPPADEPWNQHLGR